MPLDALIAEDEELLRSALADQLRRLWPELRIVAECGAYAGLSPEVMHVSAMRSDNMHRLQHVRSHATLVYTHTPPHGAFRGFGGTQMLFALNSHIDTMARELGLDPVAVHKLNAVQAGDTSVHGWKIGSTGLRECLDQCTEAMDWSARRARSAAGQTLPLRWRSTGTAGAPGRATPEARPAARP